MEFRARKPISKAYIKELLTHGDHLRKKQLDLNLLQADVAESLFVEEMTIVACELNQHQPLARRIPRTINFLGYVPVVVFPGNPFGQKIKCNRLLRGMIKRQLAKRIGIDEATLSRLEKGKAPCTEAVLSKVARLLDPLPFDELSNILSTRMLDHEIAYRTGHTSIIGRTTLG